MYVQEGTVSVQVGVGGCVCTCLQELCLKSRCLVPL